MSEPLETLILKFKTLVLEAIVKVCETCLTARLTPRGLAGLQSSEAGHRTRFNFQTPQLGKIRSDMRVWKDRVEQPLTLELLWPVPDPEKGGTKPVLVERWTVQYTATPLPPAGSQLDISTLRKLYKEVTIMLRSVYTTLRALPAHELYKVSIGAGRTRTTAPGDAAVPDPYFTYRLLVSDPRRPSPHASPFGAAVRTTDFALPRIETAFGQLRVGVSYRDDCSFQSPRRRASLPMTFSVIESYVPGAGTGSGSGAGGGADGHPRSGGRRATIASGEEAGLSSAGAGARTASSATSASASIPIAVPTSSLGAAGPPPPVPPRRRSHTADASDLGVGTTSIGILPSSSPGSQASPASYNPPSAMIGSPNLDAFSIPNSATATSFSPPGVLHATSFGRSIGGMGGMPQSMGSAGSSAAGGGVAASASGRVQARHASLTPHTRVFGFNVTDTSPATPATMPTTPATASPAPQAPVSMHATPSATPAPATPASAATPTSAAGLGERAASADAAGLPTVMASGGAVTASGGSDRRDRSSSLPPRPEMFTTPSQHLTSPLLGPTAVPGSFPELGGGTHHPQQHTPLFGAFSSGAGAHHIQATPPFAAHQAPLGGRDQLSPLLLGPSAAVGASPGGAVTPSTAPTPSPTTTATTPTSTGGIAVGDLRQPPMTVYQPHLAATSPHTATDFDQIRVAVNTVHGSSGHPAFGGVAASSSSGGINVHRTHSGSTDVSLESSVSESQTSSGTTTTAVTAASSTHRAPPFASPAGITPSALPMPPPMMQLPSAASPAFVGLTANLAAAGQLASHTAAQQAQYQYQYQQHPNPHRNTQGIALTPPGPSPSTSQALGMAPTQLPPGAAVSAAAASSLTPVQLLQQQAQQAYEFFVRFMPHEAAAAAAAAAADTMARTHGLPQQPIPQATAVPPPVQPHPQQPVDDTPVQAAPTVFAAIAPTQPSHHAGLSMETTGTGVQSTTQGGSALASSTAELATATGTATVSVAPAVESVDAAGATGAVGVAGAGAAPSSSAIPPGDGSGAGAGAGAGGGEGAAGSTRFGFGLHLSQGSLGLGAGDAGSDYDSDSDLPFARPPAGGGADRTHSDATSTTFGSAMSTPNQEEVLIGGLIRKLQAAPTPSFARLGGSAGDNPSTDACWFMSKAEMLDELTRLKTVHCRLPPPSPQPPPVPAQLVRHQTG